MNSQFEIYDEYNCSTCGAKLVADKTTIISDCVYCGSRQIVKSKLETNFSPEAIIPFKLDRNQLIEIITKRVKKQIFKSKEFIESVKMMESKGIYVPYRLYTFDVYTYARGQAERMSDNTKMYKWFEMEFEQKMRAPQDSSKKLNDKTMKELAPYDYNELKTFNSTYLNGFLAEQRDEDDELLRRKAESDILEEVQECVNNRFPSYYMRKGLLKVDFSKEEYIDVMLPVWLANIKYKNKNIKLAVNGQTGKIVGEIPNTVFSILIALLIAVIIAIFGTVIGSFILDGISAEVDEIGILKSIIIVSPVLLIIGLFVAIIAVVISDCKNRKEGMVENPLVHKDPIEIFNIKEKKLNVYSKLEYCKRFGSAELELCDKKIYRKEINPATNKHWINE